MTRQNDTRPADRRDSPRETYEVSYDPADVESLSATITEAVEAMTGTDATTLRPLYEVVDSEALDALFAPTRTGSACDRTGVVTFSYEGFTVRVFADGRVVVAPANHDLPADESATPTDESAERE